MSDNDGHKKADLFCKAVKARIGTLSAPKMNQDMLTFVAENLASESSFKAILGNAGPQALKLRRRRQAFLLYKPYVDLVADVNDQNPSCKADGANVDSCYKEFVFSAFKEILVLDTMYEQVRISGDAINPNGYFRAYGASADQIHMSIGGLNGFPAQGEPTLVSYLVMALDGMENGTQSVGIGGSLPQVQPQAQSPATTQLLEKRGREGDGMVQQTTPPYGWVCAFCHKPNHNAMQCRNRIKEEKKQRGSGGFSGVQQPQQYRPPMTAPAQVGPGLSTGPSSTSDDHEKFLQFKKFYEWSKSH